MKNILISGIGGKIGRLVYENAPNHNFNVVCGIDRNRFIKVDCPIYRSFEEVKENVDVIIDFSSDELCMEAANFAIANCCALLSGTTAISEKTTKLLDLLSTKAPTCLASNFSSGVLAFKRVAKYAAGLLKNYDTCITEIHSSAKKDAPSGTAKDISQACGINSIYSIRGGTVPGTHVLHFYGVSEELEIVHRATDRIIFAEGALSATEKLLQKESGLYTAEELLF